MAPEALFLTEDNSEAIIKYIHRVEMVLSHLLLLVLLLYNNSNFQECKLLKINKNIFLVWSRFMAILTDATEPQFIQYKHRVEIHNNSIYLSCRDFTVFYY